MLSAKENYIRVMKGEEAEFLPWATDLYTGTPTPTMWELYPEFLNGYNSPTGGVDVWGVEWITTKETGFMALPNPSKRILEDISEWRDRIKAPDISQIDWEAMAARDLANIDREKTAVKMILHAGYFQNLMNFMGYEEGLCAVAEDPEECKALMDYLCDFYCAVEEKVLEYYKPDIWEVCDDIATYRSPFLSLDAWREVFKPSTKRECDLAIAAGIPVNMHCCGQCTDFIDDWIEMGINSWNPPQECNDLVAIQKKYGSRMVMEGGWDPLLPACLASATKEEFMAEIKRNIETYAPCRHFVWFGFVIGDFEDPVMQQQCAWLAEGYELYGRHFYENMK